MLVNLREFEESHLFNHPDIIYLKQGEIEIGIMPHIGAGITHFIKKRNKEVVHLLRPASREALMESTSEFFGCFPMVPFSGRVIDARFRHNGKIINLAKHGNTPHALHGEGWKSSWRVINVQENALQMELVNPNLGWPWEYKGQFGLELDAYGVAMTLAYTNLSKESVPIGLGFHPWFSAGAQLKTHLAEEWLVNDNYEFIKKIALPEKHDFKEFKPVKNSELDTGFSGWGRQANIIFDDSPYALEILASSNLGHVIIYTEHESGAWCLEPASHAMDSFNLVEKNISGNGTEFVKPGDTFTVGMQLKIYNKNY